MAETDSRPATETPTEWATYFDPQWLARRREEIIEPALPVVDPHHHLWPFANFGVTELLADLGAGHNVQATVHLETGIGYDRSAPAHLAPVGETRLITSLAEEQALRAPDGPAIAAGLVGWVDLTLPSEQVEEALGAHVLAGDGRFRGIRFNAFWDGAVGWQGAEPGRMADATIRRNLALLPRHGLVCDVMIFHPQLDEFARYAASLPETRFVLDHLGGVLGRGAYAGRTAEMFPDWRKGMAALAACPNVAVKLGGLANGFFSGWKFNLDPDPPSSETIAEAYRPYVESAVELFGADRCMFESNFPADKSHVDYALLWNAFKHLAAGLNQADKRALFAGTARRVYAL